MRDRRAMFTGRMPKLTTSLIGLSLLLVRNQLQQPARFDTVREVFRNRMPWLATSIIRSPVTR
jgi:hypothetical protein